MKLLATLMILASVNYAQAEILVDEVEAVSEIENGERLIFFNSGRVAFQDASEDAPLIDETVSAQINANNDLIGYEYEEGATSVTSIDESKEHFSSEPTILPSFEEANNLFQNMNRSWKASTECSDRAHIWAYEDWKRHGLISQKVFVFFTRTYIRAYRYGWWFHVAPYVLADNQGVTTEYVMDRRFTNVPYTMKQWSDEFIHSKRTCPVTTYANYRANNNGKEHCYLVKSHMYNRLPLHVRNEEDTGIAKSAWNMSEVNFSYRAFSRRRN